MQRAENKSSPPTPIICLFIYPSISLLPSLCLFFDFLHLFNQPTYMNTRVFKYSTSLGVPTLSPGEHQPKQTKRQLSEVAVQGKADNICI